MQKFVDQIEHLHHHYAHDKPHVIAHKLVNSIAFIQPEQKRSKDAEKADEAALIDIITEDSRSFESLDDFLDHAEGQAAFERNETHTPSDQKTQETDFDTNKVRIETIHWAKGREWNTVFLFDISDRSKKKDSKSGGKGEGLSEEERRVAYVGMTRAINNLCITTQSQMISPFIVEAIVPRELRGVSNASARLRNMLSKLEENVANLCISDDKERQIAIQEKRRLKERLSVLTQTREKLEDEWIGLVREKPAGLISRTFFGGRSAADIKSAMREVESRRDAIEHEFDKIVTKLDEPDKKPKITAVQKHELLKEQETTLRDYRLLSKYIDQLMPA